MASYLAHPESRYLDIHHLLKTRDLQVQTLSLQALNPKLIRAELTRGGRDALHL